MAHPLGSTLLEGATMPQERVHAAPARQDRKPGVTAEEAERMAEEASVAQAKAGEHTKVEDIDELLDEIDSVLEENAAEFIRAYVQKGGQ